MDLEREFISFERGCYIINHIPRDSVFHMDGEQASIIKHITNNLDDKM